MKKSIIGAAVAAAALVCSFAVAAEEVHVAVAANFTAPAKEARAVLWRYGCVLCSDQEWRSV